MKTARHAIDIARPQDAVFDFMLDARYAAEWRDPVTRMEWIDGGPHAGAALRLHFWADGTEQTRDARLAEFDRPHRYVIESRGGGFRSRFINLVESTASGARVTVCTDVTGDTMWGTLLLPLLRRRHRQRLARTLQRLKVAAEKVR